MDIPHWAEVMLVLVGILVAIGLVSTSVTEVLIKRWRAVGERRRSRRRAT